MRTPSASRQSEFIRFYKEGESTMLTRRQHSIALGITGLLLAIASLATSSTAKADVVPWAPDLDTAKSLASRQGRLVLVHFWADNCPPCRSLEANVFSRPDVAQAIAARYVPVKVHATRRSDISKQFGVDRWPTDVVITPSGQKIASMISPQDPQKYVQTFDQIATRMLPAAPATQTAGLAPRAPAEPSSNAYSRDQHLAQAGQPGSSRYNPAGNAAPGSRYQAGPNTASAYQPQGGSAYQAPSAGSAYGSAPPATDTASRYAPNARQPAPASPPARNGSQYGGTYGNATAAAGSRYGAAAPGNAPAANRYQPQPNLAAAPGPQGAAYQPSYANQATPRQNELAISPPQPKAEDTVNPYAQRATQQPAGQPGRQVWEWNKENPTNAAQAAHTTARAPSHVAPSQPKPQAANPNPIALDGFCPIALDGDKPAWVKGDKRFGAVHRGRTYLFASAAAQQQFLADPDRYAPALSGYDPVRFVEEKKIVPGSRAFGWFYEDRYYLFADEAGLRRFEKSPELYHEVVQQAMNGGPAAPQGSQYR